MVEALLTPPHSTPLEALLDQPFASAFNHPPPQRKAQGLVCRIVDVLAMPLQVRIHRTQGVPGRGGQALDLQGIGQVGQDPIRVAMPQAVSGPAEPPTRLRGASIEPGCRTLPQLLRRMVKVGYPLKAGHLMTSSTERHGLL